MTSFAIPPKQINSLLYTGSDLHMVPATQHKRAPTIKDIGYPLLTFWRNADSGAVSPDFFGDIYVLIRFNYNPLTDKNEAIWAKIFSGFGGSILSVTTDDGASTFPSGGGAIGILTGIVPAHSVPINSLHTAPNNVTINVQYSTARATTLAAAAGMASFNSTNFTVDANGFVSLLGSSFVNSVTGSGSVTASPTTGAVVVGLTGITQFNTLVGGASNTIINVPPGTAGQALVSNGGAAAPSYQNVSVLGYRQISGNGSILPADKVIGESSTAAAYTISLPNPLSGGLVAGQIWTIKDESNGAGTNNITINVTGGTALIDGAATTVINTNSGSLDIYYNGTNYFIK
jgi:hypothetical protein